MVHCRFSFTGYLYKHYLDNARLKHDTVRIHGSVKHAFDGRGLPEHVQRRQKKHDHLPSEAARGSDSSGKGTRLNNSTSLYGALL